MPFTMIRWGRVEPSTPFGDSLASTSTTTISSISPAITSTFRDRWNEFVPLQQPRLHCDGFQVQMVRYARPLLPQLQHNVLRRVSCAVLRGKYSIGLQSVRALRLLQMLSQRHLHRLQQQQ